MKEPSIETRQAKDGSWMVFVDPRGCDVTIYRITGSIPQSDDGWKPKFELLQGGKQ